MHVDELLERREDWMIRSLRRRKPEALIARILRREIQNYGGFYESRIPIIANDIAELLDVKQSEAKEGLLS